MFEADCGYLNPFITEARFAVELCRAQFTVLTSSSKFISHLENESRDTNEKSINAT